MAVRTLYGVWSLAYVTGSFGMGIYCSLKIKIRVELFTSLNVPYICLAFKNLRLKTKFPPKCTLGINKTFRFYSCVFLLPSFILKGLKVQNLSRKS